MVTHTGGCHCGRVRFEVIAPAKLQASECNCSMCAKAGYLQLIVPADRFKLLSGAEVLTTYSFNTHTAKHLFCSVCGVKSFYVPRSHPDGFSVNVRCLDPGRIQEITIRSSTDVSGAQYRKGRGWVHRVIQCLRSDPDRTAIPAAFGACRSPVNSGVKPARTDS